MPGCKLSDQAYIGPAELGLNGVAVVAGAPVTSNVFDVSGYQQLTLEISLARNTATSVTHYFDVSDDNVTFRRLQNIAVALGVVTQTDQIYTHAMAANAHWTTNTAINYKFMRLVFDSVAGGATDLITVHVRLGVA